MVAMVTYTGVVESNSFMNALSDQAAKWQEKRVKKLSKGVSSDLLNFSKSQC